MLVPFLPNGGLVKQNRPLVRPGDPLGDETAPDIRHAKRAMRREIEQGKSLREPGGVLAVERTPRTRSERNATVGPEILRERKRQAVDGIDVRIFVG